MAVTKNDLQDFQLFAVGKIENGGAASVIELANEWESRRRKKDECPSQIDAETLRLLAAEFPDSKDASELQSALARHDGVTTAQLLNNAALAAEKYAHE